MVLKLLMFDFESWLDIHLSGRRNGNEYSAACPYCGKARKFSVNIELKLFRCFSGSCQSSGRAWQLIKHVEGLSGKEARKLLGSEYDSTKPAFMKKKAIENKKWNIDLPEEFIPCLEVGRVPEFRNIQYLKDRIQNSTLKEFGVGFCKTGLCWDRAVIPVSSPFGQAWTARDATDKWKEDPKRSKYYNPRGGWANDLLFGWPQYEAGSDLILVEGPFDVMKLYEYGLSAMALLGKELGQGQRAQLLSLPADTYVVVLIDPEEKRWIIDDIRDKLSLKFRNMFVGKLPIGVDPGSSTKKQAIDCVDSAERI